MSYATMDSVLKGWAERHSLSLLTLYRGEEVRAFEIPGTMSKRQFQIWIDPPDSFGKTVVHAWDRKKWKVEYESTPFHLATALDRALSEISKFDSEHRVI